MTPNEVNNLICVLVEDRIPETACPVMKSAELLGNHGIKQSEQQRLLKLIENCLGGNLPKTRKLRNPSPNEILHTVTKELQSQGRLQE